MTLTNNAFICYLGKRRLQALASQLKLNNHCVESAYMFLKLAVSKRLTKGRRTNHVAAACLYLVCRTEKTPRILPVHLM